MDCARWPTQHSILNASTVGRVGSALANARALTTAAGVHAAAGSAGAKATAAPDPFGVRVTSPREVSSPRCANHGVPAPNAKLRALVDRQAAVGSALQAVFTSLLDLLATRRGEA